MSCTLTVPQAPVPGRVVVVVVGNGKVLEVLVDEVDDVGIDDVLLVGPPPPPDGVVHATATSPSARARVNPARILRSSEPRGSRGYMAKPPCALPGSRNRQPIECRFVEQHHDLFIRIFPAPVGIPALVVSGPWLGHGSDTHHGMARSAASISTHLM
jgi:hypothetical protein